MRTRLIKVLDDGTQLFCLVTQFEDIDSEKCKEIGIPTNYTIYNTFRGSYISSFASYDFHPEYGENRVCSEEYAGTFKAIGTVINFIENIKYLPDVLDVGAVRNYYNYVKGYDSRIRNVLESISDLDKNVLRKFLFRTLSQIHLLIVNTETKEKIYESFASWKEEDIVPYYLWIPVQELDPDDAKNYEISFFKIEAI